LPPDFEFFLTPNPPLPTETVPYIGEPVALVVAKTRALAADAVEQVEVDWEPLPAVVAPRDALDPHALSSRTECCLSDYQARDLTS
jgi:CO/xanthine dehydrogenase Mo-binding subunit